ncbi:nucleotide-binding universal stress UspA family protein [Desulfitispora alkaliphila]|uniref:universal stress protein n=1 Tax=Desulfitispora alkaliphila TaxID=622674 RepID=UPI003D1FC474
MKRYLLALHGTPVDRLAIQKGLEVAKKENAKISIVAISTTPNLPKAWRDDNLPEILEQGAKEKATRVAAEAEKFFNENGVEVTTEAKVGDPGKIICSSSTGYDMVIMPTRGITGIRKAIQGCVAEMVSKCSSTPILFVRPQ